MQHSDIHAGLQRHSLGAIYPFSVVISERHENGAFSGACLVRNLVTGIAYGRFGFSDYGESFDEAHASAENHAASLLALESRALRNRQWWRQALSATPDYAKNALVIAAVGATSIVAAKLADSRADDSPIVPVILRLPQ